MKIAKVILYVASVFFSGCAVSPEGMEASRQFSEGLQQGMQQSAEISCAPGSVCFSRLSPEVQKQRYCDMHPSLSCYQAQHNDGSPSSEAGVVSHMYINGVYVTCVGTGVSVNCQQ